MAGMAAAATVVSIVSSVAQAANAYQNYQAQAQAANINSNVANNNARMTGIQSSYAQDAKLQQGKQYVSGQYVSNLQSGAGGAGTTGDRAVAKSAYNLEKDVSLLAYNYESKAIDFLNQAKMYNYENKVAKANAANALIGGGINVANNVLARANVQNNNNVDLGYVNDYTRSVTKPSYARNSKLWL